MKPIIITLLYLTTFGEIKLDRFEIFESCSAWYDRNVKVEQRKQRKVFSNHYVYSWADLNKSFFGALKVERNVMFIILSLIILVAAFNIISGLTIFVKNKTREIAILKSIGVQNKSIQKIFFSLG